jgi:hypothetical protein
MPNDFLEPAARDAERCVGCRNRTGANGALRTPWGPCCMRCVQPDSRDGFLDIAESEVPS